MIEYEEGSIILSKNSPLKILLLLAAFVLVGCSIRVSEPPVQFTTTKINPVKEGCLSNAGSVMQNYFDGKASEKELTDFWNCLYHSFDLFAHYTKGASNEFYTPQELGGFLTKYFLNGKVIPAPLLEEAMAIKQSILGGSTDKLTKEELQLTLNLIRVFQQETLRMQPYMPIGYAVAKSRSLDEETFEKAIISLNDATANIADALQKSVGDYSFTNLNNLLWELEKFLANDSPENAEWLRLGRKYLSILSSVKSILITPPADKILASDYRKIFRLAPRYFTLYLRTTYYTATKNTMFSGTGLNYLNNFARDVRDVILESISYHPRNTISLAEINTLVDALEENQLLPAQGKVIKDFLPVVLFRILPASPENLPSNFLGISENSINYLWQKFLFWSEGQYYLDGMYRDLNHLPTPDQKALSRLDILTIFPEDAAQKWTKLKNDLSVQSVKDLQDIVKEIRLVNPPGSKIVEIPADRKIQYSFSHLTRMNWLRTFARIVLPAYSSDQERAQKLTGLTKDEVNSFYRDVFPLAVDLKFLNPDSSGAAAARFFEANLFLSSSNGDDLLSMNEILELGTVGISVLIKASQAHKEIAKLCNSLTRNENGDAIINANCFKEKFLENADKYWSHIPGFLQYFRQQKLEKQKRMLDEFDHTVRRGDRKRLAGFMMETGETQGFFLMPYYIESVFARYDKDSSQAIDQKEVQNAYPVFRGFLASKAMALGLNSEKDFQAIFTYLLSSGNLPNETFTEEIRYGWWRYIHQSNFDVDRAELLRIFSKLMQL